MSQLVVVKLFKKGELISVKQFTTEQIVIGRNAEAQFVIDDDKVSPLHAVIESRSSGYFITDLGSEMGTFKNGQKVLEQALQSGDEFQISDFTLQFIVGLGQNQNASKPVEAPVEKPAPSASKKLPKQEKMNDENTDTIIAQPKQNPYAPKNSEVKQAKGTFAPEGAIVDLRTVLKPEKGTVVEVVVAWKDRIIQTHHFKNSGTYTIGSANGTDINVPLLGTQLTRYKFLEIDALAKVAVSTEMSGEYIESGKGTKNFAELSRTEKMQRKGDYYSITVAQGDMLVIHLLGGTISLYIRYVSDTPVPLLAPLFDLTASEVTGIILAVVVSSIFGLYMMVYAPEQIDPLANKTEEPLRRAVVKFNPPKPKQIVEVGAETQKKVQVVKVEKEKEKAAPSAQKAGETGKAASVKPSPQKKKSPDLATNVAKGGAVNTGADGANAKSQKVDPTNMGLLSAFGKNGLQKKISKSYDGTGGGLAGLADQATGAAGFKDDRAGDQMGGKLKNTGAGGQGKASVGMTGPLTDGRGAGVFGKYAGGVGKKGSVQINVGGQEEAFVGTIDREAIRRVILDNISQIRHCYEKELNKSPDMFGKLVIEWDIIEKGQVQKATVKSNSLGNASVAECVRSHLERWRFPEPPEDQVARVTYPFVFASK